MSTSDSKSIAADAYVDGTQRRQKPGFAELRRPGYLMKWLWAFVEGWFLSRNYRQLAIGLPFLLIALGGPMFVWWLKNTPRDGLVAAYESAVEESIQKDQPERTGLYLESLVRLRKLRKDYRHQLVMHYVKQGQPQKAAAHVSSLAGPDGYVPTRLWLLQQAAEPEPAFPLTDEEVDRQLNAVLEKQPMDFAANLQMSTRLMQKQQFKTAEDHLLKIVDQLPGLGLHLARVQIQLKRDREQILSHLDMADQFFQKALLKNSLDFESRIHRMDVLLLRKDLAGAQELIAEGRRLQDNQELRAVESTLLASQAKQKLRQSALNAPAAARDLGQAIQLNPQDTSLLSLALSLNRFGVKWNAEQLQPALDLLLDDPNLSSADHQLLLAGLSITGQNSKALEVTRQRGEGEFLDRIAVSELLLRDGKQEEADALLALLLKETEAKSDVEVCLNRVKVLLLMNRGQEAYALIEESQERFAESDTQQTAVWQACFAQANQSVFQSRLQNDEFQNADEAIQMLTDSRQGVVSIVAIVQRMLALMNARSDFEPEVRRTLIQLARSNRGGWQIYNMLGTYDLQKSEQEPQRLSKALKSLELAYQSQKSDPMIMNNLAIALVRNNQDLKRARELVKQAIDQLADPVDALSTRAEISVAEERWDEALADLELALAERPNSANVRRLLVKVLTVLGKPSLAEEHQTVYDQLTAVKADDSVQAGDSNPAEKEGTE